MQDYTMTIGLDIAKSVFQVHGVDGDGRVLKKRLSRAKVLSFFAQLPRCLIGLEACSSAHHWARELQATGHEVRLLPPSYVKPYVKRGKNDAIDAEAIFEALGRPSMRFVPIKSSEQQGALAVHKVRAQLVRTRTKLVNMLRAHMAEFGLVAPQGIWRIGELKAVIGDETDARLPAMARLALKPVLAQLDALKAEIEALDRIILAHCRSNEVARRLSAIPGVGPISASAFVASIADARSFRSGRHLAAFLGLTPRQNASGLKNRMGRISRMGNAYLRTLLVLGATAILHHARRSAAPSFATRLLARNKPARVVTVALANKMARIAWVIMAKDQTYRTV